MKPSGKDGGKPEIRGSKSETSTKASTNAKQKARDQQLKNDVESQLEVHHEINTDGVKVAVDHANVHLSGSVDNHSAQRLTGRVVQDEVSGVKSVQNDVEFQRDDSEAP